jgi:hypothetical protein
MRAHLRTLEKARDSNLLASDSPSVSLSEAFSKFLCSISVPVCLISVKLSGDSVPLSSDMIFTISDSQRRQSIAPPQMTHAQITHLHSLPHRSRLPESHLSRDLEQQ